MARRGPKKAVPGSKPHSFFDVKNRSKKPTRDGEDITDCGLTSSELVAHQRWLRDEFYRRDSAPLEQAA